MVVSFSLTILFGIVVATLQSRKSIEEGVDREVTATFLVRELKREFESLYFSGGKGGGLFIEEMGYFGKPLDHIIFTTYYGGGHREIEYRFEPEEGTSNTARMIKRVDRNLDGDIKSGGYPLEVMRGVKMFDVRVFAKGSWHERWNPSDGLPDLIEINMIVEGISSSLATAKSTDTTKSREKDKSVRIFIEVRGKQIIGEKGRYIILQN
jgi:hypothetical protein